VGMEKLLLHLWSDYPRLSAEIYDPTTQIEASWLLYGFIAIRLFGATLLVPVMEELFWRDYLWRTIAAPNDFTLVEVGEYDRTAFWVVPLVFSMVHIQWLTAIVWGLLIAWLLVRTKSLGACIVAHAVTNFLLGLYVLISHYVLKRNEWYFW
jgi:CAAX prenyl protease-like protein